MSFGLWILVVTLGALLVAAFRRAEDPGPVAKRFFEQFATLVPRMLCALIAAGFVAELLPKEAIGSMLGEEAGLMAIPIAAATGLLVPAGPVISFAIAAVFAKSGASTAALVTFITSWSIYAAHRILIYEIPLLGSSFLRLRATAALPVPFLAGVLAYFVALLVGFTTLIPPQF